MQVPHPLPQKSRRIGLPSAAPFCRPAFRSVIQVNSVGFVVVEGCEGVAGALVLEPSLSGNGIGQQHPVNVSRNIVDVISATA